MVSFYDLFMYPLEKMGIHKARKRLIPQVKGTVLEIGSGTGVNLKYYDMAQVEKLIVSDKVISKKLKERAKDQIELLELDVHALPFEDKSFDYIVHTLVFCSVDDVEVGLKELRRVLKDDGTLIFIEHILPEKHGLRGLFNFINPLWNSFADGCNLNRDFETSAKESGFNITCSYKFMNTVFVYGKAQKE
jgi:ubiquinone/menaquinone biosynthesis C-methylase UbiE